MGPSVVVDAALGMAHVPPSERDRIRGEGWSFYRSVAGDGVEQIQFRKLVLPNQLLLRSGTDGRLCRGGPSVMPFDGCSREKRVALAYTAG